MKKDFEKWHENKSDIDQIKQRPFFHEREIWFAHLGANVGFEQDGKGDEFLRPVLIIKKFNNETLWGISLTSKEKIGKYYFSLKHNGRESTANLSQFRLIDCKRLKYKIGSISDESFLELKKRITELIN